jgi:uncharacterized protein YegL
MAGEAMIAMNQGLSLFQIDLLSEPRAAESVWITLISFGNGARTDVPLTGLAMFCPPTLQASGSSSLGAALRLLNDSLDRDVVLPSVTCQGDYQPIVLIFLASNPADEWREAAKRLRERRHPSANVIAVTNGTTIDASDLAEIAGTVLLMEQSSAGSFQRLLSWIDLSDTETDVIGPRSEHDAPARLPGIPPFDELGEMVF